MDKNELLSHIIHSLIQFSHNGEAVKIIEAIDNVDRVFFVSEEWIDHVYEDIPLPIGDGQTISQPSTVARMLHLLDLRIHDDVLEIGTGSGWNSSLMGYLASEGKIVSYEIIENLAQSARKNIQRGALTSNIEIRVGDFLNVSGKFDRIIFTAGIEDFQEEIIEKFGEEHLKDGGILICPRSSGPIMILKKFNGQMEKRFTDEEYSFVPLDI